MDWFVADDTWDDLPLSFGISFTPASAVISYHCTKQVHPSPLLVQVSSVVKILSMFG